MILQTAGRLFGDFRYSIRSLAKDWKFAFASVATLALVIAANTGLFSVVYGVVIRHLPYQGSERLVMLWESNRKTGTEHLPLMEGAYPIYKREVRSLENVAAFVPPNPSLPAVTLWQTTERVKEVLASAELFELLNQPPVAGRLFVASDDRTDAIPVALLSHRFWIAHFNAEPNVIGTTLSLNEFGSKANYVIVGIMPQGFDFPYPLFPDETDVWLSLPYTGPRFPSGNNFLAIGRLRPGIGLLQAQAELDTIAAGIQADYPRYYGSEDIRIVSLQSELVHDVREILWSLLGALGFILLIGSANISSLLMARAATKQKETILRISLGATRTDLIRQLCAEAVLLAAGGGAIGFLIAYWGVGAEQKFLPESLYVPRLDAITLNAPVLAFTVGISFLAAVVFGLLPSLRLFYVKNIGDCLKTGTSSLRRQTPLLLRAQSLLLMAQISLTIVLLAGSVFMAQSLRRLLNVDLHFNPERLVSMNVDFSNSFPDTPKMISALYQQFLSEAGQRPTIKAITFVDRFPLSEHTQGFKAEAGTGVIAQAYQPAEMHVVSPGYFAMMGVFLKGGRLIQDTDSAATPPVAVINTAMETRFWPHMNPIGLRVTTDLRVGSEMPLSYTIIGVATEPPRFATGSQSRPAVFVSYLQVVRRSLSAVALTTEDPRKVSGKLRETALAMFGPDVAVDEVQTGQDIVASSTGRSRFIAYQLSALTLLALILSLFGEYGLISFYTNNRTYEIGVRMALGATSAQVLRLVVRQGMSLVIVGLMIGITGAGVFLRILSSMMYGVRWTDLMVFALAVLGFVGVAFVASYMPARVAATIDPMKVLRQN
jgi:putative ABC transport system permease protein